MMADNVTLPLAMRSSLLSLKDISNQMSKVQEMLSTGKEVNSAIDDASSYYTAQSLTHAAADLNALLDAMGQGIQTIQAANVGMETQAELIAQASGLATKAVEIFALEDEKNIDKRNLPEMPPFVPSQNLRMNEPLAPENDITEENLTEEQKDYMASINQTLAEIDDVVNDASYKGINLLKENTLSIKFSNNPGSLLMIKGVNSTLEGLGLKEANWLTMQDVQKTMEELTDATNKLRTQMSQIGNYYAIVTNRETFTQNLINILEEGADKLTLADMNEVSAKYLSLQTAQRLAINSLSLAAQSARSVLIPFAAQQIYAENQAEKADKTSISTQSEEK